MEMPQYVSHKKVWALEIDYFGADLTLHFKDIGYTPIQTHKEMCRDTFPCQAISMSFMRTATNHSARARRSLRATRK